MVVLMAIGAICALAIPTGVSAASVKHVASKHYSGARSSRGAYRIHHRANHRVGYRIGDLLLDVLYSGDDGDFPNLTGPSYVAPPCSDVLCATRAYPGYHSLQY